MSNDPMEASNTTEGPDHLKDMRKVKICDIHGSWPIREVHVDTTAVCCTTTRSFVEASDQKVALSVLKTDYKCQNPDHVDAIRLQVRGVDSYDPDCIKLCVLEDERSYAVMTGTEPCFKPQSEGEEHIGVIKTKVITEGTCKPGRNLPCFQQTLTEPKPRSQHIKPLTRRIAHVSRVR